MRYRLLCLLGALALGACDVLGGGDQLQFSISIQPRPNADPEDPRREVRTEQARIVVEGEFISTCSENTITADATRAGRGRINVKVIEEREGAVCTPITFPYIVIAVIGPLDAGRYQVDLIHRAASGQEQTVLTRSVDVL